MSDLWGAPSSIKFSLEPSVCVSARRLPKPSSNYYCAKQMNSLKKNLKFDDSILKFAKVEFL